LPRARSRGDLPHCCRPQGRRHCVPRVDAGAPALAHFGPSGGIRPGDWLWGTR
jgi:hypothetical protein